MSDPLDTIRAGNSAGIDAALWLLGAVLGVLAVAFAVSIATVALWALWRAWHRLGTIHRARALRARWRRP